MVLLDRGFGKGRGHPFCSPTLIRGQRLNLLHKVSHLLGITWGEGPCRLILLCPQACLRVRVSHRASAYSSFAVGIRSAMEPSLASPRKPITVDERSNRKRRETRNLRRNAPDDISSRLAQNHTMVAQLAQGAATRHLADRNNDSSFASALLRMRTKGIPALNAGPHIFNKHVHAKQDYVSDLATAQTSNIGAPSKAEENEVTLLEIEEFALEEDSLVLPMKPCRLSHRGPGNGLKEQSSDGSVERHLPAPCRASGGPVTEVAKLYNIPRNRSGLDGSLLSGTGGVRRNNSPSSSGGSIPLTSGLSKAVVVHPSRPNPISVCVAPCSTNSSLSEEDYFQAGNDKLQGANSGDVVNRSNSQSLAHDDYLEFTAPNFRSGGRKRSGRRGFLKIPSFLRSVSSSKG